MLNRSISMMVLVVYLVLLTACGGGGGGGDGASGDAAGGGNVTVEASGSTITLSSVVPSVSAAIASMALVNLTINFQFNDSDGDLDGGTLKVDWEGRIIATAIPSSWAGVKSGSSHLTLSFPELSPTVGDITVLCWLTDKAGHESSRQSFAFRQTAPNWPWQWGTADNDMGAGIAVDPLNNIFVVGQYGDGSANPGGFIAKYLPTSFGQGLKVMATRNGRAVSVDSAGKIYAAGEASSPVHVSVFKYDTNGGQLWERDLSNPPGDVLARGIAVDGLGNVFVTGSTSGDLDGNVNAGHGWGYDMFLVKYDSAGNKQWTRQLGTSDDEGSSGVVTDSTNCIYVAGGTGGDLDGNVNPGSAAFMTKYDTSGTKQWTILIGAGSSASATAITKDATDNLYIVGGASLDMDGVSHPHPGYSATFLTKYDTSGTRQWTQLLGSATSNGYANAAAVDHNGAVYVTGQIYGTLNAGNIAQGIDAYLAKYDSTGAMLWVTLLGTGQDEIGYGLAVDGNNFVYVTGSTTGNLSGHSSAGYQDVFIAKFDENGIRQ